MVPSKAVRSFLPWLLLAALACAHTPRKADPALLRTTVDQFHERLHWNDFHAASGALVPERRERFLKARSARRDDKDLTVTECEVVNVDAREGKALITTRMRWIRLPSASEQSDEVVSEWVDYDGTWLLARQTPGPFEELAEEYTRPADAGTGG